MATEKVFAIHHRDIFITTDTEP